MGSANRDQNKQARNRRGKRRNSAASEDLTRGGSVTELGDQAQTGSRLSGTKRRSRRSSRER